MKLVPPTLDLKLEYGCLFQEGGLNSLLHIILLVFFGRIIAQWFLGNFSLHLDSFYMKYVNHIFTYNNMLFSFIRQPFAIILYFRNLREMFKIDASDYMVSLCGADGLKELSSPGKSGSIFYLSQDERFVLKTLRKDELKVCTLHLLYGMQHFSS